MREHILLKAIYQNIVIIRKNKKTIKIYKKTRIIWWGKWLNHCGIESTYNGIEIFSVFLQECSVSYIS